MKTEEIEVETENQLVPERDAELTSLWATLLFLAVVCSVIIRTQYL